MSTSKKKPGSRTADDVLAEISPREAIAFVPTDGTALLDLERLILQTVQARRDGDDDAVTKLDEQIRAATARLDKVQEFHLRSIGHTAWKNLVAEHPPTKQQRAKLDHNPDTFWPAALAAMLVDPEMTVEQVGRFGDVAPEGVWQHLVKTAMQVELSEPGGRHV